MSVPTLLLSPDGSRDRNGPVTPSVGSGVTVVSGQYGNAWRKSVLNNNGVRSPIVGGFGTVIARVKWDGGAFGTTGWLVGVGPWNTIDMQSYVFTLSGGGGNFIWSSRYSNVSQASVIVVPSSTTMITASLSVEGGVASARIGSEHSITAISPFATGEPTLIELFGHGSALGDIESVLLYDTALTDDEIERISTMDEAWTWEGVIRAIAPKIGGVMSTHALAPFAVNSTHGALD